MIDSLCLTQVVYLVQVTSSPIIPLAFSLVAFLALLKRINMLKRSFISYHFALTPFHHLSQWEHVTHLASEDLPLNACQLHQM